MYRMFQTFLSIKDFRGHFKNIISKWRRKNLQQKFYIFHMINLVRIKKNLIK